MKLNLAQLQVMECLLNSISYRHKFDKHLFVIKIDNHLVSCKFFNDYSEITPMINSSENGIVRTSYLSQNTDIRNISNTFYKNMSFEFIDFKDLLPFTDLLLKYLYDYVSEFKDIKPAQELIYDVNFLFQDKHFDFYYLDTAIEYEVISLIQV